VESKSRMCNRVKDLMPLRADRKNSPTIFFVTPSARRPSQKADLTRLAQTLARINNLHWVVVEDAEKPSPFIDDLIERLKMKAIHLNERTPADKRLSEDDPGWKMPKGVEQRNAALQWIRTNHVTWAKGVVYFGDDDNTYDWRLFSEIRTINRVGVWPVGIVGGLLVEAPIVEKGLRAESPPATDEGRVIDFNSVWKPSRPFPIDMAAFAVNITLVLQHRDAVFTYETERGYQESHFLRSLNLSREDLEPKADGCTKVYVWHTRTEETKLGPMEKAKLTEKRLLSPVESDAIGDTLQ